MSKQRKSRIDEKKRVIVKDLASKDMKRELFKSGRDGVCAFNTQPTYHVIKKLENMLSKTAGTRSKYIWFQNNKRRIT